MRKETILVVAAHPDDEVLGCGGTIARKSRDGHDVHIAVLGEGMTSRNQGELDTDASQLRALDSDCERAAELLGAKELHRDHLPDNRLDTVPLLDVIRIIENIVGSVRPSIVYTQHGGDLNIDHKTVFRATMTALRPIPGCPTRSFYAYEVASSTEWAFRKFSPTMTPNSFVDISETLEHKIDAMQIYESEVRPFPHPRSPQALRAQARHWGATVGVEAAEAFELVWALD